MTEIYINLLVAASIAIPLRVMHLHFPAFVSRKRKWSQYMQEVERSRGILPEGRRYIPSEEPLTWKENVTILIDCAALSVIGLMLYQSWVMYGALS